MFVILRSIQNLACVSQLFVLPLGKSGHRAMDGWMDGQMQEIQAFMPLPRTLWTQSSESSLSPSCHTAVLPAVDLASDGVLGASRIVCFPQGIDGAKGGEEEHEGIARAVLTGKSHKEAFHFHSLEARSWLRE